jgi:reactive intermediate/imine deaminase
MKKSYTASTAPAPVGPYSHAIQVGNTIYLSGQISLNPATMTLIGEDFASQAHQVFKHLAAVAKAAGGDINDIVKITVYLMDLSHFPQLNEVMQEYFKAPFPARTTFQVAGLPKGALIEVDAIMCVSV